MPPSSPSPPSPLPPPAPPWPPLVAPEDSPVVTSPPQLVTASEAPTTNAAARLRRRGAPGIARSARPEGSSAEQNGHEGSVARTCLAQEGHGTSGWDMAM